MNSLRKNQEGLASIVIVIIIISLVTLITVGFAVIVRREQRQALDQQLTTQARLASESVINAKIAQYRTNPGSLVNTTGCIPEGQTFTTGEEIQTTCVQIDTAPGPLNYDQVRTDGSTLIWLDPNGAPIDRVLITWQNLPGQPSNNCMTGDYATFPQSISDGSVGMLRFDIARVGLPGETFTRESLRNGNLGGVLHPKQSGVGTHNYTVDKVIGQPVVFGTCNSPISGVDTHAAHATIDLPDEPGARYILRLKSLYHSSTVRVIGFADSGTGNVVEFVDSQIAIEATTRVGDIVQRVQVRVPAGSPPSDIVVDDALHAAGGGICKLLQTEPSSTEDDCI